jgi:CheY-like chemotaxis protein
MGATRKGPSMLMAKVGRPVVILLVEDNPGDVLLTQEGLRLAKLNNSLHVARDGVEAMEFLRREGKHAQAPRPDLILLDLNMPRMSGREVLSAIRSDPELELIPVAILTTSTADEDVISSYKLNANCYIRKPVNFDEFVRVVKSIEEFWFTIVELPIRH